MIDKVVMGKKDISNLVIKISEEINIVYHEIEKITIVPILDAVFMFASDLSKRIRNVNTYFKFVKVESYNNGIPGKPILHTCISQSEIENRDVLIVDTIIDSGNTIRLVRDEILKYCPKSLRICALVVKKNDNNKDIKVDFSHKSGVEGFLFGYGTDFEDGSHKNVEYIFSKKG